MGAMTDAQTAQTESAPVDWHLAGDYEDILYETTDDGIAKITINRPEVHNAFRPQTIIEIVRGAEVAREDESVGVIILTGEGDRAFCSGGDQRVRGDTRLQDRRGRDRPVPRHRPARRRCGAAPSRSWRWSPAGRSAAATSCTWCAT